MARIFITGTSDGLGQLAAKDLVAKGHDVLLHARNEERGRVAQEAVPKAMGMVAGDLSTIEGAKDVASQVNSQGRFDAVIHNAAVYQDTGEKIFAVNVLAPYILTCLIERPERLVYMSSGMHGGGSANLDKFKSDPGSISYSDSKLHMLMLSNAVARHWPTVYSNAIDPGWVPTKMGGQNAPDSLEEGYETQVWLAVSDDPQAKVSGKYFHHKRQPPHNPQADDIDQQERFLTLCEEISGVSFPRQKSENARGF